MKTQSCKERKSKVGKWKVITRERRNLGENDKVIV